MNTREDEVFRRGLLKGQIILLLIGMAAAIVVLSIKLTKARHMLEYADSCETCGERTAARRAARPHGL